MSIVKEFDSTRFVFLRMIIQAAFKKCWNDTFCHDYHLFRANVLSIISRHKATSSAYFFPCVHISVLWIIPIIFFEIVFKETREKKELAEILSWN